MQAPGAGIKIDLYVGISTILKGADSRMSNKSSGYDLRGIFVARY